MADTMKCAVFYGKHDLRIEERAKPAPGAEEVLIRVMACGVCGTDVHIYEGDKGCAPTPPGTVLGHEFSGVVEAVGERVKDLRVGDRVCADPNDTCGACDECRGGNAHFCAHMTGIGTTVDGGFAGFCVLRAKQVYRLREETSFDEGAMAEPVSCCLHGIDLCGVRPGGAVAVIGGGMIGLLMVQLAKLAGAGCVALLEPVDIKRERGRALGADVCIDPLREEARAALERAGVPPLETVIECAGLPSTVAQAIELAGNHSVVMLFGLTKPDDTVAVRPFELFQKEITLKSSYINPYTLRRALNLIDARRVDVSSMVAQRAPLKALPDILSRPEMRAKGKYIIHPWED